MFEIQQVRELKARKALLVSECALDRSLIAAETALFEQKTRWPQLLFSGFKAALPHMKFLLPVAGWLVSRAFGGRKSQLRPSRSSGAGVIGLVRKGLVAWQLFKKGREIWFQWRGESSLRRLKSAK